MSKTEKVWKWVVGILAVIGALSIYILFSKSKADEKVKELEDKIKELEGKIKEWEKKKEERVKNIDFNEKEGKKLDKEINKRKSEKVFLTEKLEKMKSIFEKYNKQN